MAKNTVTDLSATDIHSQANNFLQALQSSVDSRTGQFNLAISIPLGHANDLGGPSWSFTLAFSSLGSQVDTGFGLGWDVLCTQLVTRQDIWSLRLSSGERFAVNAKAYAVGDTLELIDYKLKAMQVFQHDADTLRIEHKSGEREFLSKVSDESSSYVLRELRSAEGRSLFFHWITANDVSNLQAISDNSQRHIIRIDTFQTPRLVLQPDSPFEATVEFLQYNNRLGALKLPGMDALGTIDYVAKSVGKLQQLLFPTQVVSPLGAKDTVTWSEGIEHSHQLPADAPIAFIPRVIGWTRSDSTQSSALQHAYQWTGTQNYLGGGAQLGFDWRAGRDYLYQLREQYQYSVTETQRDDAGKLLATIERTWDRHHLLIQHVTQSGRYSTTVDTVYGVDYSKTWEEQLPQCQLAKTVTITVKDGGKLAPLITTTRYEYDEYGNTLRTVFPTGVEELNEYYPVDGKRSGCPKDASGMVRYLLKKTVKPAPDAPGAAPTLSTRYEYKDLPSMVTGDPPHAVIEREEVKNESTGQIVEFTTHAYLGDPANTLLFGRLQRVATCLQGKTTTTRLQYQCDQTPAGEPLLKTTTTIEGFEQGELTQSTVIDTRSLITGLTYSQQSAAGVRTLFNYDALGRITRTLMGAGSPYEAQRTCRYHLDDDFAKAHAPRIDGAVLTPIGIEETDATGQRKRTWLDGSGRPLLVQLEDLDHLKGEFLEISTTRYDALGRVVEQSVQDWAAPSAPVQQDRQPLFKRTTRNTYDDWGNVSFQITPTGLINRMLSDPLQRCVAHWQETPTGKCGSKVVTFFNVAGSPVTTTLYDDTGQEIRSSQFTHDGLERVIKEVVKQPGRPDIVKAFEYDVYGRVVERREQFTEDEKACIRAIRWTYAGHSDGPHPLSIDVQRLEVPSE